MPLVPSTEALGNLARHGHYALWLDRPAMTISAFENITIAVALSMW